MRDLFKLFEDQAIVLFTGKINALDKDNSSLVGSITFVEGVLCDARFSGVSGYKGFYSLLFEWKSKDSLKFVVEPELINVDKKSIHLPISTLKRKFEEIYNEFLEAEKHRPPKNIKILVKPEFIESSIEVEQVEYNLLCTISDYNKIEDIYKNSELLDYEITNALVNLRKKDAIKVIKAKEGIL